MYLRSSNGDAVGDRSTGTTPPTYLRFSYTDANGAPQTFTHAINHPLWPVEQQNLLWNDLKKVLTISFCNRLHTVLRC